MIYYDVTVPVSEGIPVWPGDPAVHVEWANRIDRGDDLNLSRLQMGSHTGTHVDAPFHFIDGGATVEQVPVELLIGPAYVASLEGLNTVTIHAEELAAMGLPAGIVRLLLKTRNSAFWHERGLAFQRDFTHLGADAARWLVERGIQVIGIDYLSIGAFEHGEEVHHILLGAGVIAIEGLDLSQVPAGPCQLICLPLKIEGGDGAPARVVVGRD